MFRRIGRLFVPWEVVKDGNRFYHVCSNEVAIEGDATRWSTDRFRRLGILWWLWRTFLLLFNWNKRQILRWAGDDEAYVAVFIPTTPSPVNGFYFYVRKADTIELEMTVDVALRSIVSMGVVADSETGKHRAITQNP